MEKVVKLEKRQLTRRKKLGGWGSVRAEKRMSKPYGISYFEVKTLGETAGSAKVYQKGRFVSIFCERDIDECKLDSGGFPCLNGLLALLLAFFCGDALLERIKASTSFICLSAEEHARTQWMSRQPFMLVPINGIELYAMIDTGAQATIINFAGHVKTLLTLDPKVQEPMIGIGENWFQQAALCAT
uniref:Peptidase A2 domain-containing protein n=1 Tax=Globodera rostochiensis TaxID=31243 RepID=A0A914H7K2_GLORO